MTREEAIWAMQFYKEKLYNGIFNQYIEAFDMAIAALREQETVTNRNGLNRTESDTVKVVDSDQFKTNGDRFRAMSDEELADYLSDRTCPPRETNCVGENCMDCWLQYLRQPAEVPT